MLRYLLRDQGSIYNADFQQWVWNLGIEEVKLVPRSPWQNPYCERFIYQSWERSGSDQKWAVCIIIMSGWRRQQG